MRLGHSCRGWQRWCLQGRAVRWLLCAPCSSAAPACTHSSRGCRGIVPAGFPLSRSRAPAGSTLLQGKAARAETPVPDEMSSFVSGNSLKLVLSPVFQWKSFLYAHVQPQQVLRGSLLPSCGCLKHWGSDYSLSAGNIYD